MHFSASTLNSKNFYLVAAAVLVTANRHCHCNLDCCKMNFIHYLKTIYF